MAKKDNKISMPQTGAGLVRYFDEESLGPKLSPEHVIVLTIILAIFCFILRYYGAVGPPHTNGMFFKQRKRFFR